MSSNRSSDGVRAVAARVPDGVRPGLATAGFALVAFLASGVAAAQDGTTAADDGTTTLLLYVGIGIVALVLAFASVIYLRRALAPETEDPLGRT